MQRFLPTPPPSPKSYNQEISYPSQASGAHLNHEGTLVNGWLELERTLGEGAYGTVYAARNIYDGRPLAVKALNKLGLDKRQQQFQKRETQLHVAASSHPNVVPVYKIMDSPTCTYVVMEYCSEGDLFTSITEDGFYTGRDDLVKSAFLQILDAVESLHNQGIFHRDLKPENILITNAGYTLKLADFGLATMDRYTSDFGCGSTFYMSPECQAVNPNSLWYDAAANDVWSLGVVLVNLACGRNPWKKASIEDPTFKAYLKDPEFLSTILPITEDLQFILRRIFEMDPSKRITLPELKNLIQRCNHFSMDAAAAAEPVRQFENYQQVNGQLTPVEYGSPYESRCTSPSHPEETYQASLPALDDVSMHIQGSSGSASSGWSSGSDCATTPATPISDSFGSMWFPDAKGRVSPFSLAGSMDLASYVPTSPGNWRDNRSYYVPQYGHWGMATS